MAKTVRVKSQNWSVSILQKWSYTHFYKMARIQGWDKEIHECSGCDFWCKTLLGSPHELYYSKNKQGPKHSLVSKKTLKLIQIITSNFFSILFYNSEVRGLSSLKKDLKHPLLVESPNYLKLALHYPTEKPSYDHKQNNTRIVF
jgi:hypothetical protein